MLKLLTRAYVAIAGIFSNQKGAVMDTKTMVREAKKWMKIAVRSQEWIDYCANTTAEDWTYTEDDPSKIRDIMVEPFGFEVHWYKPPWWKWWWRGIPAYTERENYPNKVFVNTNINWRMPYMAGVLAHEVAHLKKYGHGSNVSVGKKYWNSVPIKVQKFVESYVSEKQES